ncbi:hypothetical protein OROMI_011379 [Orobanche minor]
MIYLRKDIYRGTEFSVPPQPPNHEKEEFNDNVVMGSNIHGVAGYNHSANLTIKQGHGTTTIALFNVTQIVVGTDSRSTNAGYPESNKAEKIHEISEELRSNLLCTASGKVAKWNEMFNYVKAKVLERENITQRSVSATFAKDQVVSWCRSQDQEKRRPPVIYSIILTGWPRGVEPEIYRIKVVNNSPTVRRVVLNEGGVQEAEPFRAITGSGIVATVGLCYKALFEASLYDPFSGGRLRIARMTEGHYRVSSITALESYVQLFDSDLDKAEGVLFLFQPAIGRIMMSENILESWVSDIVPFGHAVFESKDFFLHPMAFANGDEEANAAFDDIKVNYSMPKDHYEFKHQLFGSSQSTIVDDPDHYLTFIFGTLCCLTQRSMKLLKALRVSSEGATPEPED